MSKDLKEIKKIFNIEFSYKEKILNNMLTNIYKRIP